ncbi:NADH:ubiquinone oxidoreductase subunit V3 [Choristoneura fumiferana]|uniref:NADH:ubiquinone oxidoreductase subunit V3 n=1 Tax=Choristoneura fumiferana TaxID=7141 RepID=UPI003D1565ED
MIARSALRSNGLRVISRCFSEGAPQSPSSPPAPASGKVNANVTGLSHACIAPASQPVGPGVDPNKSGAYKVPEYFCYNNMSYFEAEIEMSKYRCPQPSALKK